MFVRPSTPLADPAALHFDAQPPQAANLRPATLYAAPLQPVDEHERLAELKQYALLDTPPDEDCDRLVQLATALCGTAMGAFTLVDAGRNWYKASVGLPVKQVPRDKSFCAYAIIESDRLLEIPDVPSLGWADLQPWGADGPTLGFYAAAPLRTREGSAIGTLCVMDSVPRRLTGAQREGLAKLAKALASHLQLKRQLRIANETDRLTGLPNWFHFEVEFERTKPAGGVICFVRLKTINQINSAHGFRVADGLIKQTAQRLRSFADEGACIARIKRGLFIMFFPAADAQPFARQQAPDLITWLQEPYEVNGLDLLCPVNVGFAAYPRDGTTLDEVVNAADAALQFAIERDQPMAFFDKSIDSIRAAHYRLEPRLRRAIDRDEFVNYYQPKIDLMTGKVAGVEALVRWQDPVRGLVPPGQFVPALESTGLIGEVGARILDHAIRDWKAWRAAGLQAPRIAVNVAAAQLRDEGFVNWLRQAIVDLGGETGALGIEVTENILISDMEGAITVLSRVRELGIPVAIDDFGTGYSSLAYIVTLPIDELKIDQAFVRKLTSDTAYEGIVKTCVSLAHGLRLKVVAEGVETEAQARMLKKLKCDQAQGFFYSQPVPADQLAKSLPTR
jgi:predicted signal transduction protein with EAL and GGDEF domain